MQLSHRSVALAVALALYAVSTTLGTTWNEQYEGDVLPNAATPAWAHGASGGATTLSSGVVTISNYSGSAYAANSWDLLNDPYMTAPTAYFQFNDPDVAGVTWATYAGPAFTVEWRMKVDGNALLSPSTDQVGVKLVYAGYGGSTTTCAYQEWYYDGPNQRLMNNRYTWGSHTGATGAEGSESTLSNDGFPAIGLNEWHTYRVTSASISGRWHRELWLDGAYVGRWWDETTTTGPQIKMRANSSRSTNGPCVVEFDYVRWANTADGQYVRPITLAPQTLLANQSFETDTGPTQGWFGSFFRASGPLAMGGRYKMPTPTQIDGVWIWELASTDPAHPANGDTWQTVPIRPGSTATFNGYVHVGNDPNTTDVGVISLWDGDKGAGNPLATATINPATPKTDGDWVHVQMSGLPTSGYATVEFTAECVPDGHTAAVHYDAFSLTSSGACTTPVTVTGISPTSALNNANIQNVTVSGTNLNLATAVKLVQMSTATVLTGTITNVTPTALTVNFPNAGQPVGKYNVVVEQPDCLDQQLTEGFTNVCPNPSTITAVSPSTLVPAQGVVQLTISGTNLADLINANPNYGVSLVRHDTGSGHTDAIIPGTNLFMNGVDLVASFDFSNAPEGYYDVTGSRGTTCDTPTPLVSGFSLLPTRGTNLLVNGNFDTGSLTPWTSGCSSSSLLRNVSYFNAGPHSPSYFIGTAGNSTSGECTATQTLASLPNGPGYYDLTLSFYAFVWDTPAASNTAGFDTYVKGTLVVDGIPVATVQFDSMLNYQLAYYPVAVRWKGSVASSIAVQIKVHEDGRGDSSSWGEAAADDIALTTVGCNHPFADMDADQDVDLDDFAIFQRCFGAFTTTGQLPGSCLCLDRDHDGAITGADFNAFAACGSGASVPADPNCGGS